MANQVADSLWQERLFAQLTAAFSTLALALACIGLYGTISYGVGRRRAEIALRIALGARRVQVLWLVLRRALALAIVGIAVGVPLAMWAGSLLSSFLFGLTPRERQVLAMVVLDFSNAAVSAPCASGVPSEATRRAVYSSTCGSFDSRPIASARLKSAAASGSSAYQAMSGRL